MLKEIRNNVYHAEFVVADEDGQRYAAFESDWNGEYWEATACTESGELIKGETVKLYPVMVYLAESDQYETVGYDEEAPRVLLPAGVTTRSAATTKATPWPPPLTAKRATAFT